MENFKSEILEILKDKNLYDIKILQEKLNLRSTADFIMLNKALNQLIDENKIILNKDNRYVIFDNKNILKGIININNRMVGYLDLEGYSIKIESSHLNGAMDKDEVVVRVIKRGQNLEGYVETIVSHNTKHLVGTIRKTKSGIRIYPDDEKLKNYKLNLVDYKGFKLVNGLKFLFKIVAYNKNNSLGLTIDRLIGHKDDPGIDILSILLDYDIDPIFSDEVMDEVNKIPDRVLDRDLVGRKDLRNETIITIDGDDSKDFDDAISINKTSRGYELGVHIADVSYYVKEGSQVDKEARYRGTSTYVVDRVVPMLPHVLSNGICSLNEGVDRLTITCLMNIDFKGEVIDYDIFPSVIKSKARMTYKNVNKILNNDPKILKKYEDIKNIFYDMHECASLIRKKRVEAGAIDFEREEALIDVDSLGNVKNILKRERGESERIIEDFMVLCNECLARYLKNLSIPALYRIHERPKLSRITDLRRVLALMSHPMRLKSKEVMPKDIQLYLEGVKTSEDYPIISTLTLRSMQKARYDVNCLGHFGLSLNDYLHFTSPIRRYPDLVVHRMLRKYIFDHNFKDITKDELLMNDLALETSTRERNSVEAEREVESMKMAEYMQTKIGKVYEGQISSVTKFGFFVELENLVEGLVHISSLRDDTYIYDESTLSLLGTRSLKRYSLGQKVLIKVIDANKNTRTIDFVLYNKKSKRDRWI